MITIPIWAAIAALVAIPVAFFAGFVIMACLAMAGYDGDQQRSEPE